MPASVPSPTFPGLEGGGQQATGTDDGFSFMHESEVTRPGQKPVLYLFYTSFSQRVLVPILSKQFVCFLSCSAHGNRPTNTHFVSPSLPPSVSEY